MINMEPVLKRGYTAWDQALLPADEFTERVSSVRAAMGAAGLDALLVWGNQYEYADFTYLAGMPSAGTLLLTNEGDPAVFTGGGGRELPFQRTLTWVTDLSAAGPMPGKSLRTALHERNLTNGSVGMVGTHLLSSATYANVNENLADYRLKDFSDELRRLRARKRPREVATVRTALRIATDAADAAAKAFSDGATTTEAMIAAERAARVNKARDFRMLANVNSTDLRPFEGFSPTPARTTPLLLWIGVDYHGYWADTAVTSPSATSSQAQTAVDAMVHAARAGARASDVARAGLAKLSSAAAESALDYGLGSGIGLALADGPNITPDSDEQLVSDALLSLRALARDGDDVSFASAIVQVASDTSRKLSPL